MLLNRYVLALRLMWRLLLMAFGSLFMLLPIAIVSRIDPPRSLYMCAIYHRYLCWCFDFRVDCVGEPVGHVADEPVLYVINHISWVDILALGSIIRGCFVARGDLAQWPVFGRMADLQRTIYVNREARHRAGAQRSEIADRLVAGDDVLLFPEGTSGSGTIVLPFKSTLFGIIEDDRLDNLVIQPVTLSYTEMNGMPLLRARRDVVAWVGDMGFGDHIARLLSQHSLRAHIQFHPAVRRSSYANRKLLARACEKQVADGLERANMGRIDVAVAMPLPPKVAPEQAETL
jgi:lyso-ornithine lipid O-acyltransferase